MLTWAKLDSALKNQILCRFMKRSPTTPFSLLALTERPHPTRLFRQNPGVERMAAYNRSNRTTVLAKMREKAEFYVDL
jgi:hypothetical protein